MAINSEVVLHTKFRYKPENDDKYIMLYFQNSTNDVILSSNIDGYDIESGSTLSDVLVKIAEILNNRALKPLYDTSRSLKMKDPILAIGQFGIESDTLRMKVGNGKTPWNYLKYAITNEDGNSEYMQVITNTASKIVSPQDGTELSTMQLNNLKAADEAPAGAHAYVHILDTISDSDTIEETP